MLRITSAGNATFAGDVTVSGGDISLVDGGTIGYGGATKFTVSSLDTTSHNRGFYHGPGTGAGCNYTISVFNPF